MIHESVMTPFARVRRRLIPFLFILYVVSYLDRINVGFAALQMNEALGFSPTVYGFGAGVFFLSYVLFEIPSNLVLDRVGVRIWIARIMITWGLVSSAMMFVRGPSSFFVLRFLLGAAEAGFFPGIILYLTRWFPERERAKTVALFMTATALAGVVGGPVSGLLLQMHGAFGLHGWQWLFLLEGLPAVVLGFLVLVWLPDRPEDARWLSAADRVEIATALANEHAAVSAGGGHVSVGPALRDRRVWLLAFLYFTIILSFYGVSFWLPQILASFSGAGTVAVAFLSAVPYMTAAVGMVVMAIRSDRSGERNRVVALSALIGVAGFVAAAELPATASLAAISIAALGIWGALGPFWALPPRFLTGPAAAGGIALINSVGNIGGFVGPYAIGFVRQRTGSFEAGLYVLAASLALTAVLALVARRDTTATA